MHGTKKTHLKGKKVIKPSPKRGKKEPTRKGKEVTTPWPEKGEEGHGTMVVSIENIFKRKKWEAWWQAVYPYELDLHNQGDESPDSSDTDKWNKFWKIKRDTQIEAAKELLGVDPSVDVLMWHALSHYKTWYRYPDWN